MLIVKCPLRTWLRLGTQLCYEAPSDLRVENWLVKLFPR